MRPISSLFDEACKRDLQTVWKQVSLFGNNLAFDKPATASSQLTGWEASKVVNATIEDDEGWSSQNVGSATPINPEWIYIDLFWKTEIDKVILYPRINAGTVYSFPVDFKIQVGKYGTDWTDVITHTAYPQPTSQNGEVFEFGKTVCRYIRIYVTKFSQDIDLNYYVRLAEIQVIKKPITIFDFRKGSVNHIKSIGEITWELDTTGLNEWKTGNVRLDIDNHDNQWNSTNPNGLFTYQLAQGAQIQVKAGYLLEDGTQELLAVFTGYITDPIRHSDTSGTLIVYNFWERLEKKKLDDLKDPTTSTWYANKQVDFLAKKIFAHTGFTRFEYVVEVATTVIPTADFSGMSARDGIIKLAEVMNYECGIDTLGKGFFRSRIVTGKPVSLEVRNKKGGNKNLVECTNVSRGWDNVINHFVTQNAVDVTIEKEPLPGRPNSYDRYGHVKEEISNKFLKQLSDIQIQAVLSLYFDMYSEAKIAFDATITFLPQVEIGDVHLVSQHEPYPTMDDQLEFNVGQEWNSGRVWGSTEGFLIYLLKCKVIGLSINLEDFTIRIKYREV